MCKNVILHLRKLHSGYLELQEAHARIKDLEDEIAEQANEYKSLETMVNVIKLDASKSGSEVPLSDKIEKTLARPRDSSAPFRWKPENQNHAIIFTHGEVLQTIDMNQ
nr:kinesin motor domain-containing protein [Tanacetum cinerariifolium]